MQDTAPRLSLEQASEPKTYLRLERCKFYIEKPSLNSSFRTKNLSEIGMLQILY